MMEDAQMLAAHAAACGELIRVCTLAWQEGMFAALNGNASMRLPSPHDAYICVTGTGTAKGRLAHEDFCLAEWASGTLLHGSRLSTEVAVHQALYATLPDTCKAVLHTHPPKLMALSLVVSEADMLRMPLYECEMWRPHLGFVPQIAPGSRKLGEACGLAARELVARNPKAASNGALWLAGHGLCCFGENLATTLNLSEEMEHLAAIQLHARSVLSCKKPAVA